MTLVDVLNDVDAAHRAELDVRASGIRLFTRAKNYRVATDILEPGLVIITVD